MHTTRKLFVLYFVGLPLYAAAQESDPVVRRELWDASDRTRPIDPTRSTVAAGAEARGGSVVRKGNEIEVWVEADPVQRPASAGIRFVLDLRNTGRSAIELDDPFDAVNVKVVDHASGQTVSLPPLDPDFFDCSQGVPEAKLVQRVRQQKNQRRAFEATAENRSIAGGDHSSKSVDDIRSGILVLEPGEGARMYLTVRSVLANPDGYLKERILIEEQDSDDGGVVVSMSRGREIEDEDVVLIGPGQYDLWISVWVRDFAGKSAVRWLQTEAIQVDLSEK